MGSEREKAKGVQLLPKLLPGSARKLMLERNVAKIDRPQTHPGMERFAAVKPSAERLFRDKYRPSPSVAAKYARRIVQSKLVK